MGQPILAAYREVHELFAEDPYTPAIRDRIRDLLLALDICYVNTHRAVRRRLTKDPKWAWLRKSRGDFDREPRDATESVEIVATGHGDWIGWVELATQPVDELATRMTARVIREIAADVMGVIEAEDRPASRRISRAAAFSARACVGQPRHAPDGVGKMTRASESASDHAAVFVDLDL